MARTTYRATWAALTTAGRSRRPAWHTWSLSRVTLALCPPTRRSSRGAFIVLVAQSFPERDARQAVILIDTSTWVEFLRDTGSVISARVDAELDGDTRSAMRSVWKYSLADRDESQLEALPLLARASVLPTERHYDEAAT